MCKQVCGNSLFIMQTLNNCYCFHFRSRAMPLPTSPPDNAWGLPSLTSYPSPNFGGLGMNNEGNKQELLTIHPFSALHVLTYMGHIFYRTSCEISRSDDSEYKETRTLVEVY